MRRPSASTLLNTCRVLESLLVTILLPCRAGSTWQRSSFNCLRETKPPSSVRPHLTWRTEVFLVGAYPIPGDLLLGYLHVESSEETPAENRAFELHFGRSMPISPLLVRCSPKVAGYIGAVATSSKPRPRALLCRLLITRSRCFSSYTRAPASTYSSPCLTSR